MGMMDKAKDMKDKATDAVGADEKIDEAAKKADEKTGGKASEQIDQGTEKAKEGLDKLGG